jgi:hypothetical protein
LLFNGDEAIMIYTEGFDKIMMVSYPFKVDATKIL